MDAFVFRFHCAVKGGGQAGGFPQFEGEFHGFFEFRAVFHPFACQFAFASYITDIVHDIPGRVVKRAAEVYIFLFSHEAKLKSGKEKNWQVFTLLF
jgi:hypothetical protein